MNLGPQQPASKPESDESKAAGSSGPVNRTLLAMFIFCLGLLVGGLFVGHFDHSAGSSGSNGQGTETLIGPWGTLQVEHIEIEPPDEFIPSDFPTNQVTRWFFEDYSTNQLAAFFSQPDITDAQRTVLLDSRYWELQTNGVFVTPGSDTILSLSPDARARIYSVLARSPVNLNQQWAFKMRPEEMELRFSHSGLASRTLELVRHLLYQKNGVVCFSDVDEAMALIPDREERRRFFKMMCRQPTVVMKLRVSEGEDVEPLVNYWGRGDRAKEVRPLLESLARIPGGGTLDVSHLLTPFARMRLNVFPLPSNDPFISRQDCAWTSMNFYNDEPDGRFYDFEATKAAIRQDYHPVAGEPAFGDVVWFSDVKGNTVHIAVYVAADYLFTKNGADYSKPWLLMSMKDLLANYTTGEPLKIVFYRRNSG